VVASQSAQVKPDNAAAKPAVAKRLSHNLAGQKLGRKGRDTRDRILAAAAELLADPENPPFSLSAVARKVPLGMTSLYNYFSDLTELLLAILEPIMASAEQTYLGHMRQRWEDENLGQQCYSFMDNYYRFWQQNTKILHLRNALSEGEGDRRMGVQRVNAGIPMVRLFTQQMDGDPDDTLAIDYCMATALFTGVDRLIAVRTMTTRWSEGVDDSFYPVVENQLRAEARLLELAIRDGRERNTGAN
jgi:AcrR family transcriptional regulator